jgi:hypothetical protein
MLRCCHQPHCCALCCCCLGFLQQLLLLLQVLRCCCLGSLNVLLLLLRLLHSCQPLHLLLQHLLHCWAELQILQQMAAGRCGALGHLRCGLQPLLPCDPTPRLQRGSFCRCLLPCSACLSSQRMGLALRCCWHCRCLRRYPCRDDTTTKIMAVYYHHVGNAWSVHSTNAIALKKYLQTLIQHMHHAPMHLPPRAHMHFELDSHAAATRVICSICTPC